MTIMRARRIVGIVDGCSLLWPCWLRWLFLVASSLHSILWSRISTVVINVHVFSCSTFQVNQCGTEFPRVSYILVVWIKMVIICIILWSPPCRPCGRTCRQQPKLRVPSSCCFLQSKNAFTFYFLSSQKTFTFTPYFEILGGRFGHFGCFTITKFSPVNAPAPASASSGAWKEIKLSWQGWCDIPAETKMMWCSCCVCDKDGD